MNLRDAMHRMMEDSFVWGYPESNGGTRYARIPVDAYVTENEIVVEMAVPGVKPEDVEITYEGETLTIKGAMPARLENVNYVFAERFHGEFSRTLTVGIPVKADEIEATFDNGVLTLVLPKAEEVRPKSIKVTAKK
jgi:HSP20 family protein